MLKLLGIARIEILEDDMTAVKFIFKLSNTEVDASYCKKSVGWT